MAIEIKKNDYVKPNEVREKVVQAICDAFLCRCAWSTFYPKYETRRNPTLYVVAHKSDKKFYGFMSNIFSDDVGYRIRGCEMAKAFEELTKAGYYMFRIYTSYALGVVKGYKCSPKPQIPNGLRITKMDEEDFID